MNIIGFQCIVSIALATSVLAKMESVKFNSGLASELRSEITFKRVASSNFGRKTSSSIQCASACATEVSCMSVYKDGDACVFGVHDVNVFEQGEVVTVDASKVLKVKGRAFKTDSY